MSLSSTINVAQSALSTNAALSTVLSRNIAGVNDPNYSRKIGNSVTGDNGIAVMGPVTRAADDTLLTSLLSANADAAASQALADGLNGIEQTVKLSAVSASSATDATTDTSPATLIATLTGALQQYEASPGDTASGQAVLVSAKALTANLNAASAKVQDVRAQADKDIATTVADVNSLLVQFGAANLAVIKGTASGSDYSDALDKRDAILKSLSSDIGLTTVVEPNGGLALFTDSGATLFQGVPRSVSFTPTVGFAAGTTGGSVSVDGVAVTGASAAMAIKSGKLVGLTALRDTVAPRYQNQLDQIASGLVGAFADTDQNGGAAPTVPGLFTWNGAPAMPGDPTGLAAGLTVAAAADPSRGGSLDRLRDGNIGDPGNAAYNANPGGAASFSGHLTAIVDRLNTARAFDPASGGSAQATVAGFAASSVSWLEASRQSATGTADERSAVATQTAASLSSTTGVNLDEQLSKMLDLEHSYQASAQILTTVKAMYDSLLAAA